MQHPGLCNSEANNPCLPQVCSYCLTAHWVTTLIFAVNTSSGLAAAWVRGGCVRTPRRPRACSLQLLQVRWGVEERTKSAFIEAFLALVQILPYKILIESNMHCGETEDLNV